MNDTKTATAMDKAMNIYISGAITGRERMAVVKHFAAVEEELEERGYTVFNPVRISDALPEGLTHEEYMTVDMAVLGICSSIYMLNGWEESLGANRELGYALGRGMNVLYEIDEPSIDS